MSQREPDQEGIPELAMGVGPAPVPPPQKHDNRPLLIGVVVAVLAAILTFVLVARRRVATDAMVTSAAGPSAPMAPQKSWWAGKFAGGGGGAGAGPSAVAGTVAERAGASTGNADIDVPISLSEFLNILGSRVSEDKRAAFLDAVQKDPAMRSTLEGLAKAKGGRFSAADGLAALNSHGGLDGVGAKFGAGPGAFASARAAGGGLGPVGGVASDGSPGAFGSVGRFGANQSGSAASSGPGGRFESVGSSQHATFMPGSGPSGPATRQTRSNARRDGSPVNAPYTQTRLNGGQWNTQLAQAGGATPDDFGWKPHAWAALNEADRQSLKDLETEDHNQPGPEQPGIASGGCSGAWCQVRSCGKHCVYCYHKYPYSGGVTIGCGGPQNDYDGPSHANIKGFCLYGAGSFGACRQACEGDHNPPCDQYNGSAGNSTKQQIGDGIGPPIGADNNGTNTSGTDDGKGQEACVLPCGYTGTVPPGCVVNCP